MIIATYYIDEKLPTNFVYNHWFLTSKLDSPDYGQNIRD